MVTRGRVCRDCARRAFVRISRHRIAIKACIRSLIARPIVTQSGYPDGVARRALGCKERAGVRPTAREIGAATSKDKCVRKNDRFRVCRSLQNVAVLTRCIVLINSARTPRSRGVCSRLGFLASIRLDYDLRFRMAGIIFNRSHAVKRRYSFVSAP
jgi:hypothetical protein